MAKNNKANPYKLAKILLSFKEYRLDAIRNLKEEITYIKSSYIPSNSIEAEGKISTLDSLLTALDMLEDLDTNMTRIENEYVAVMADS